MKYIIDIPVTSLIYILLIYENIISAKYSRNIPYFSQVLQHSLTHIPHSHFLTFTHTHTHTLSISVFHLSSSFTHQQKTMYIYTSYRTKLLFYSSLFAMNNLNLKIAIVLFSVCTIFSFFSLFPRLALFQ